MQWALSRSFAFGHSKKLLKTLSSKYFRFFQKRAKLTDGLQLELLEMRVNTILVRHGTDTKDDSGAMSGWIKLFHSKYRARTLIGVMMMFFQRMRTSFISLT